MMKNLAAVLVAMAVLASTAVSAHDAATGRATAILNEGVIVEFGNAKVLFDPIYDNGFNTFPEMSEALKAKIIDGAPPYDDIDAVFVSHFHADHFSTPNMLRLLKAQSAVQLFAPEQAVAAMRAAPGWDDRLAPRITALSLQNDGPAARHELGGISIEAVRTPHIGWPKDHRDVQNITFRVTFPEGARVMHMGDADSAASHFAPYAPFFARARTSIAFVPFWFLSAPDSDRLFDETLNVERAIGIHVPVDVPDALRQSGKDYFSKLGEERVLRATP